MLLIVPALQDENTVPLVPKTFTLFTLTPLQRTERAEKARVAGLKAVEGEMRSFLEAVSSAYETHGVDELALTKIGDFLKVKYGGTNGAKRVLGEIAVIKQAFVDIQSYLYRN